MAVLTLSAKPNKRPVNPGAPGDTAWHTVTKPSGLPDNAGVEVAVNCTNAAGTGAGSVILVSFDTTGTPSTWFPVLPGQTLVVPWSNTYQYAMTVGTDVPYFLFLY